MTWNATGIMSSSSYLSDCLSFKNIDICGLSVTVYTYFIATNYSNGVGSQVLATLVTTLPLHIQINQSL